MRLVVIFAILIMLAFTLVFGVFVLGWTIDPQLTARMQQPEQPYVVVQDDSYRINEKEATMVSIRLYSDDQVTITTQRPLLVVPDIAQGASSEALDKAARLGLTGFLFTNREDCAEPFFGKITLTVGIFRKTVYYTQCALSTPVQQYHRYLFDTFLVRSAHGA